MSYQSAIQSGASRALPHDAPDASAPDARSEDRIVLLYRVSTVVTGRTRGFCILKNISSGGAMIETVLDLAVGETLTLGLASGVFLAGQIQWREGSRAGIRLEQPIDVAQLLARFEAAQAGVPVRRMPRLAVNVPVVVTGRGATWQARLFDISTGGVRLACEDGPHTGAVSIRLPGLGSRGARVLWSEDDQLGCVFDQPLSLEELNRWAASITKA